MTARTPHELALALLDEIDKDGSINTEYTADYSGKAPRLINVLQRELALHEGVQIT